MFKIIFKIQIFAQYNKGLKDIKKYKSRNQILKKQHNMKYLNLSNFYNQRITNHMQGPKQTYKNLRDFVEKTKKLLTKELQAQKQDFQRLTSSKSVVQIEQEGAGLSNMTVLSSKQGFYDRIILTLAKSYYSQKNPQQIPEHCKLQVGDDVAIYSGDKMIAQGIIYRRTPQKIKITVNVDQDENQNVDFQDMKVNIILKWNEVTYRRYFKILEKLQNPNIDINLQYLFFRDSSAGYRPKQAEKIVCQKMNENQNIAIANGLTQACHLIHGPPGTGKTTTVCELIVQAVKKGERVLACAPSNIAVDNIVEGISHRVNCVRVGNPARIINNVIERCLDFLISRSEGQWKNEEKKLNSAIKKLKRTKIKHERKQIYAEMKMIRTQIKNLQQQIIQEILSDANVICCTNVGADDRIFRKYLNQRKFDLIVIDECGQGLQVSCWIPISRGKRVILAGDHKQLPPTVKFQQGSLLSYTLFSRCMEELTYLTTTMLQVQYRMNKSIMGWSNNQFYENRLKAHKSVQNHILKQLYGNVDEEEAVLLFVDTAACQVGQEGGSMQSKMNVGQADIATHIFKKLIKYGVKSKDIAILTPYSKQVTLIKNVLTEHQCEAPEVSTVDGIQGREKECIIISLVRSNPEKQIGFLKDWRRMNVAVTRARRMLIIIGDSDCVTADENIKTLIEWVSEHGTVQSAQQLREDQSIRFGLGKIIQPGEQIVKKDPSKKQKSKKNEQKKDKTKKVEQGTNPTNQIEQSKKMHSIEEEKNLKQTYRALLNNLQQQIVFKDLNGYERKMMHQVAEQFGFQHVTSEDKSQIAIKPIQKTIKDDQPKKKKKDKKKKIQTENPPKNLKQLIGEQSSQNQEQVQNQKKENKKLDEQIEQKQEEQKTKPEVKKKKNKKGKQQKQEQQQDWQKLLTQFTSDLTKNDQCFKCKKKITSVTSTQCQFCRFFFCRHDLLAEEHGCEDAARQHARRGNLDKYLEEGAKKIKQKMKEQEEQRRKKPKDNKEKDKKK